ncbi:protein kinase domain-containing protein [Ditylenchus destructor]|nr:protein kinase domain-containing protein [Ditylenchus destructor]
MATPIAPLKIKDGDVIKGRYVVKKKLGEGACGSVYLVSSVKDQKIKAAMKAEPFMTSKDDEILKMEIHALQKIQFSKHVCRTLLAGKTDNFSFLVMTLLGKELSELRRRVPGRKFSRGTCIKIGIQATQALCDLHTAGFIHRDVKPDNFACDFVQKNLIILFDFGLARQILVLDENKKPKLREPRTKVAFRGTVRYCSLNVHHHKEQGRHDDLWGMLFMLIELVTGTLPWKGMSRRDSGMKKEKVTDKELLEGCPQSFAELYAALKKMNYYDKPRYAKIRDSFKADLVRVKAKLDDPFEWETKEHKDSDEKVKQRDKDEKAEKDETEDTDTGRDAEGSVESQISQGDDSGHLNYDVENTLDDVKDMRNKS